VESRSTEEDETGQTGEKETRMKELPGSHCTMLEDHKGKQKKALEQSSGKCVLGFPGQ